MVPPSRPLAEPGGHPDVLLPGGRFRMGDHFGEVYPDDSEEPVHDAVLDAYRMDATAVPNAQVAAFVAAKGYRTESERFGSSAVFDLQVRTGPQDVLRPCRARPGGPPSAARA